MHLSTVLRAKADVWSVSSPAGKILRRVLKERAAKEVLEASERLRKVAARL